MKVLPATLGASDEHYQRLGLSRDRIEEKSAGSVTRPSETVLVEAGTNHRLGLS